MQYRKIFIDIQPVLYKRYFRCNNCFLLLVYTINLSLSTDLVDPPPMGTFYMKHALCVFVFSTVIPSFSPLNICTYNKNDIGISYRGSLEKGSDDIESALCYTLYTSS